MKQGSHADPLVTAQPHLLVTAPTELDLISLPHLLAKAQPLQSEFNYRMLEWLLRYCGDGRRRRGCAAKPTPTLIHRAERDIAAKIKEDQAAATAELALLRERFVQSDTPVPEALVSFVGLPAPQAKAPRRGRKVKNAARDWRIVIRILLYTRLYRRKPASGATPFEGACKKTAKRFGLSRERVLSIYKRSTIADRAQIAMRMLNKQPIRDAQQQKEK